MWVQYDLLIQSKLKFTVLAENNMKCQVFATNAFDKRFLNIALYEGTCMSTVFHTASNTVWPWQKWWGIGYKVELLKLGKDITQDDKSQKHSKKPKVDHPVGNPWSLSAGKCLLLNLVLAWDSAVFCYFSPRSAQHFRYSSLFITINKKLQNVLIL